MASIAVDVKDPTAWGVTPQDRSGSDPFVLAIEAVTVVSHKILQDASRSLQSGVTGVIGPGFPSLPPPQVRTFSYLFLGGFWWAFELVLCFHALCD